MVLWRRGGGVGHSNMVDGDEASLKNGGSGAKGEGDLEVLTV